MCSHFTRGISPDKIISFLLLVSHLQGKYNFTKRWQSIDHVSLEVLRVVLPPYDACFKNLPHLGDALFTDLLLQVLAGTIRRREAFSRL